MSLVLRDADPVVDVCRRGEGEATELFISVRPRCRGDVTAQAAGCMQAVAEVLRRHGACILHERIFAEPKAMASLAAARTHAYGELCDPVEPTWLAVPENACGAISGIQVHAVAGAQRPAVLSVADRAAGRLLRSGGLTYLAGCNVQADDTSSPASQARQMITRAEELVKAAGGTLADVSRTWMWLGGILGWYNDFNRVRNELFASRGLLRADASGQLPASTGIGIGPGGNGVAHRPASANARCCAMDFCATIGRERPKFLLSASRQNAASKYGSAFSRAAVADTPAGKTIYVSGTAAIDAAGQTTHLDDAPGQIEDTIRNVYSVLHDAGGQEEDIVHAIVYCKNAQVEQAFRGRSGKLAFPYILAIADVCRDNLLFEIEATAMPRFDRELTAERQA